MYNEVAPGEEEMKSETKGRGEMGTEEKESKKKGRRKNGARVSEGRLFG